MNANYLCIHGHFYQPPREDPWMDLVQPEGTAAPAANWNERIVRESYGPLAYARRLDGRGRISDLVNCYEWMNFNVGPTLLHWLQRHCPDVYARILEADRRSVLRFGHGNAMAQVYHHQIMPLASALDKEVEVAWAVADFRHRFGREPEGLWLSETAVDTSTLEVLADHDIRFTILAPNQVREIREEGGEWRPVREQEVDISRPWRVGLPSGRSIAVFFYNGPLSSAVAFNGLLRDGEQFWRGLTGAHQGGLTSIGTDGETYGHHHRYGEMALAYVLEMARSGRDGFRLTNYAAYLAENPPTGEVRLHEPSSWSCAHGVERWRADCGCTDGGHPGWHQRWRAPLRNALNELKHHADQHFLALGGGLFHDPVRALKAFGGLLCGAVDVQEFKRNEMRSGVSLDNFETAIRLLRMQQWGLCMFASCAWFFDDMARVEPRNALTYALRTMELAAATGAADFEPRMVELLAGAEVNDERFATGAELWAAEVLPRRESGAGLAAQGVLAMLASGSLAASGETSEVRWPGAVVEAAMESAVREPAALEPTAQDAAGRAGEVLVERGWARLSWLPCGSAEAYGWERRSTPGAGLFSGAMRMTAEDGAEQVVEPGKLFWKNREHIVLGWLHGEREEFAALAARGRMALSRFLEYRAYQATQVWADQWAAMWPEMAAAFVLDGCAGPAAERLVQFLRGSRQGHASAPWLENRLGAALAAMVRERESAERLGGVLARARDIGLEPQLWRAQNLAWEAWTSDREAAGDREVMTVLGFGEEAD